MLLLIFYLYIIPLGICLLFDKYVDLMEIFEKLNLGTENFDVIRDSYYIPILNIFTAIIYLRLYFLYKW